MDRKRVNGRLYISIRSSYGGLGLRLVLVLLGQLGPYRTLAPMSARQTCGSTRAIFNPDVIHVTSDVATSNKDKKKKKHVFSQALI